MSGSITDVPGIRVGHYTDLKNRTGCTVILCENGAIGGIDIRGFAPGTRQVNSLEPLHPISRVDAICLAGGGAFGLDAGTGVVKFLKEKKSGFNLLGKIIPIVPTAVIFDLFFAEEDISPTAEMGYGACINASNLPPQEGSVGAGTGATVGKIFGVKQAMKGGIGTASARFGEVSIGVLAVVNSYGDVINPGGKIIAGARKAPESMEFYDMRKSLGTTEHANHLQTQNTTLAVVATDAELTKNDAVRLAIMAQDGIAHAIAPSHTIVDGDVVIAISTGTRTMGTMSIGSISQELVAESIRRGIMNADGYGRLPAYRDLKGGK